MKILQKPQFTGYKEIKMVDLDTEETPDSPDYEPPAPSISRPSSASIGLDSRSVSVSTPTHGTPPIPRPDGPSGGSKGLDPTKMCGICGSADHFTHNCDNDEAKENARGTCFRCGQPGHTKVACRAERCLACGECGHLSNNCKSSKVLSKFEKSRLERDEFNLKQRQDSFTERQRQRQLGGHDPKIPVVQATNSNPPTNPVDNSAKRKREGSASNGPQAQRPRTGQTHPPINTPRGPLGSSDPGLSGPVARGSNVSRVGGHPGLSGPPRANPVANARNGYKGPPTNGPPGVSFPVHYINLLAFIYTNSFLGSHHPFSRWPGVSDRKWPDKGSTDETRSRCKHHVLGWLSR
jgi:Arginine methyltransferase-interacting protein, contains RING Zn-finger